MGWFWADAPTPSVASMRREADSPLSTPPSSRKLPHNHPAATATPPPSCPMHKSSTTATPPPPPSSCPYPNASTDHNSSSSTYTSTLNPLNLMPHLPQTASPEQVYPLPTARTVSSIPKGTSNTDGHWEYPSPQQMYHAMVRKGYKESSPEEIASIENMVAVHNFLNEGAWQEILHWEHTFAGGILAHLKSPPNFNPDSSTAALGLQPRLLRFQGRSKEPSPKVRFFQFLGQIYPARFATEPPFDRHDWFIIRNTPSPDPSLPPVTKEVRYVIDYYSGPPEPTGEPVFYLDVRPALDSPQLAMERAAKWAKEVWDKASGAEVRARGEGK